MDKMTIANMAIGMIGGKLLKSDTFQDETSEGKQVRLFYDACRQEVLCEHPWSFATLRAALATIAGQPIMTEDAMTVIYALPDNYLKMVALSDFNATYRIESGSNLATPTGKVLLSNINNLKIKYIYDNDDPSTYFPKFSMALAVKLASIICFPITESAKKAEALAQRYINIDLISAMSADSGESTQDAPVQDEWEVARFRAASDVVAPPGAQTWHYLFQ